MAAKIARLFDMKYVWYLAVCESKSHIAETMSHVFDVSTWS